jgi:hypothetical protein
MNQVMKVLQTTLRSSLFCKASSLILGFLLWNTMSDLFTQRTWVTVPICFYAATEKIISSPMTISLELEGKPSHLKKIDKNNLAIHINAQSLQPGANQIPITQDLLHMPSSIQLLTAIPQKIVVHVKAEAQ